MENRQREEDIEKPRNELLDVEMVGFHGRVVVVGCAHGNGE